MVFIGINIGVNSLQGPAAETDKVVATRGEVATAQGAAASSGNAIHENRFRVHIGATGVKSGTLRAVASAFYVGSGDTSSSGFRSSMSLEVAGVSYPVTWDGGVAYTDVPAGAAYVKSDPVSGLGDLAANTEVWGIWRREYAVGANPVYVTLTAASPSITGELYLRGSGSGATKIGSTGAITATTGWTALSTGNAVPIFVGEKLNADECSFGVVGASIEAFTSDTWGDGVNGAGGYIRRGFAGADKQAYMIMAKPSESAESFRAGSSLRRKLFRFCDTGLQGYGGNDFSQSRTVYETWADFLWINGQFRAAGATKTGLLKPFVKPNKINQGGGWTEDNQVEDTTFTDFRDYLLTQFEAEITAGRATGIITASDAVKTGEIWKNSMTTDGVHPLSAGHGLAADELVPSLVAEGFIPA